MRRAIFPSITLSLLALACSAAPRLESGPVAKPSPTPPPRAPLTGRPVAREVLSRPALAVKIENSSLARPQVGLERADIVYEEEVEGGITRFIAIFHSRDAAPLGPVRSARLEDPDILVQYRALFVYSGGARHVVDAIRRSGLVTLTQDTAPQAFERVRTRRAPHNLFTSTQSLYAAAGGRGAAPEPVFELSARPMVAPAATTAPTPGSSPASSGTTLTVTFSPRYVSTWRFDETGGNYLRWQSGEPHRVASGAQLQARNVLVQFVRTQMSEHRDVRGNRTPEAVVTGSGRAILLRDGVAIEGRWRRPSLSSMTRFETEDGRPMRLGPGTTWVELVPTGRAVRYS